jgi:dTDP-4-amino-4,6-dideoxygalactose transaminase
VSIEESHAWHLFVVRSAHRDALQKHLSTQGIQTLVHYPIPPHRQPAYASLQHVHLPLTEQLHKEVLSLPMGPTMSSDDVDRVIAACQSFERDA